MILDAADCVETLQRTADISSGGRGRSESRMVAKERMTARDIMPGIDQENDVTRTIEECGGLVVGNACTAYGGVRFCCR